MIRFLLLGVTGFLLALTGCDVASAPHSTASDFQQSLQQSNLVLVKFGAPWCGPCRRVDSELDTIASQNAGHVTVLRINVDEEPELAQKYKVSSIPRLFLFHQGQKKADWTGYRDASEFQESINDVLGDTPSKVGEVKANPFASS